MKKKRRKGLMLRLIICLVCLPVFVFAKPGLSQKNVSLKMSSVTLEDVLKKLQSESDYYILFNRGDVKNYNNINIDVQNTSLEDVLNLCLTNTNLTYILENKTILIKKSPVGNSSKQEDDSIVIKGKVVDMNKKPIFGVTIILKGNTYIGTTTKEDGTYEIKLPKKDAKILVFSFVGMKTKEVLINNKTVLNVRMEDSSEELEGVVVTGYFERNKNSFTGAAKVMKGDDLRKVSTTNVFAALSILDPSVQIKQNNNQGSSPNALPEIIIRGTSSLNANQEFGINSPLIVIDGVESSIRALYDMNIFDIESVVTLKDASATALYGEQASNGVILVTRKKNFKDKVRFSYNLVNKIEFADLSAYKLMDARQKLDFELKSGLYGNPADDNYTGEDYLYKYLPKLARVNSGINTYWLEKPIRNSFSHNHSINVSGETSGLSYQLVGNYGQNHGVMKGDERERMSLGSYFSYNYENKLIVTLRTDYSQNNTVDSKYGSFENYAKANPYDSPFDVNGKLQKSLSYGQDNPLYEASLSSFSKSTTKTFATNLNVRWNIMRGLFLTGFGTITSSEYRADRYKSPLSYKFDLEKDPAKRGDYSINSAETKSYLGKITLNFNRNLDEYGSMLTLNLGGEIAKNTISPYEFVAEGFLNDNLVDITFAAQYPKDSRPLGQSDVSTKLAFISSANLIYKGRFFVDGSMRMSGSSKFGSNKRFAPYWSTGIGWNLHREEIFNSDIVNLLRIRGSYGHTGSLNFRSYQAMTTYRYSTLLSGKASLGAIPITMGNQDLKAQTTKETNIGITSSLWGGRLDFNFDYYNKRTVNMVVPVSMPYSSGVSVVSSNVGEQLNRGFEFSLSGLLLRTDDFYWRVSVHGAKNYNELVKIGDVLKKQNDSYSQIVGASPTQLFVEGESMSSIYAVRSAGIDPADGLEIFIDKNGNYTKTYNYSDKVALGDAEPKLRGSISTMFSYKNFSFNMNMMYSLGGYLYNSTRANKIEMIDAKYNSDVRAYTKRWEKPGDLVEYVAKNIVNNGQNYNVHSSRFVEKENYLSIPSMTFSYQFDRDKISRYKLNSLNISLSINDVAYFSTVARERGTSYPFARSVSFTISTRI